VGRQVAELLRHQLQLGEAAGRHGEAMDLAHRLLALDAADESAHMALMRLLTASGRRWAALEQYELCRQSLAEQLGARPSSECYALYVRIHAQAAPVPRPWAVASGPPADAVALRAMAQPFSVEEGAMAPVEAALIGREREVAQLTQALTQGSCRWVSLQGPLGMGKSAVARALAAGLQAQGSHDLCWIDAGGGAEDWPRLLQRLAQGWGAGRSPGSARWRLIVLDGLVDGAADPGRQCAGSPEGEGLTPQERAGGDAAGLLDWPDSRSVRLDLPGTAPAGRAGAFRPHLTAPPRPH
jgi:hypothetical protein